MRVAIISDTHIGQRLQDFPRAFYNNLGNPDIIVHSGDFTNLYSLEKVKSLAPVFYGVQGNMDDPDVKNKLPQQQQFQLVGKKFALIHGWSSGWDLHKRVYNHFKSSQPDYILFGHSHIPFNQNYGGIRLLNPGSVSGNIYSDKGSLIIMSINGNGEIDIEFKEFKI